ncbi:OmpA family protein [Micromonospora sp. NPDC047467]|uniref:OmpA family protein n=1 Tax=Micromonospora sp. NPDC047467 TaxID=3154814 RepID=UPI0034099615
MSYPSTNRLRRAASMLVAGLVLAGVAGCSDDEHAAAPSDSEVAPDVVNGCELTTGPVAVAYGARANTSDPRLPGEVSKLIDRSLGGGYPVSAIRLDGSPVQVFSATFESTAGNDDGRAAQLKRFRQSVDMEFANVRAEQQEADVLAALSLAARSVSAEGGTVVLVDSGLQTTAPLDFRDGALLAAEPADVTTFLEKHELLPDLKGRAVLLVGIGNTVAPQPAFDQWTYDNLNAIWKAVATEAGARCVAVLAGPGANRPRSGQLPVVTPVSPAPEPTPEPCGQTVLSNSGKVGFLPNRADFVDSAAARSALTKMAPTMAGGNQRIELIGTTATDGTHEGRRQLSLKRADAVKRILVELGVAADRITTRGAGIEWEGHEPDLDRKGVLMPGPAARNRSVVVKLTCPSGTIR